MTRRKRAKPYDPAHAVAADNDHHTHDQGAAA
jgi:hypothetical protein